MALGASLLSIGIKRLDQGSTHCRLYNVTDYGAISSACDMAFQCGMTIFAMWLPLVFTIYIIYMFAKLDKSTRLSIDIITDIQLINDNLHSEEVVERHGKFRNVP